MNRRSFFQRAGAVVFGVLAAVYVPALVSETVDPTIIWRLGGTVVPPEVAKALDEWHEAGCPPMRWDYDANGLVASWKIPKPKNSVSAFNTGEQVDGSSNGEM